MSFFKNLFAKKDGGTFVGKLWRALADRETGGIFGFTDHLNNRNLGGEDGD
jgi:hypothetical protein